MYRDADYQTLLAAFDRASIEHREIELRSNTAMVLEERHDSKATAHLLFRGMYDQPRELVEAATPSFLPPMAAGLPRNRLGLARWMVDRANPLFSRVTVNRFWQEFFGAGHPGVGRRLRRAGASRPRIPNCSTGWRSSSASPAGT